MSYELANIQLNRACYLLRKSKYILVCGHQRPDGDCIGSMLALKLTLNSLSKRVSCVISDTLPPNLWFLPGIEQIKSGKKKVKKINKFDLIVSLDSSSLERSGLENLKASTSPVLNIDHHQDNSLFGSVNIVKLKASSAAEILYDLLLKFEIEITRDIATCLLCGIFFDTDAFRNPNTTSRTLEITSQLLSKGACVKKIVRYLLQEKSLSTLRLWGKTLARLSENKKLGIISTVLSEEDIKQSEAGGLEGIANYISCFPQAKATLLLSEKDGLIHGNLRTQRDDVDVSKLALLFGGGGHKKAAGFTISGKLFKTKAGWKVI